MRNPKHISHCPWINAFVNCLLKLSAHFPLSEDQLKEALLDEAKRKISFRLKIIIALAVRIMELNILFQSDNRWRRYYLEEARNKP